MREIVHHSADGYTFPLHKQYVHDNNTLEGLTERLAPIADQYLAPPIFQPPPLNLVPQHHDVQDVIPIAQALDDEDPLD